MSQCPRRLVSDDEQNNLSRFYFFDTTVIFWTSDPAEKAIGYVNCLFLDGQIPLCRWKFLRNQRQCFATTCAFFGQPLYLLA
jgi:hypothetical protein